MSFVRTPSGLKEITGFAARDADNVLRTGLSVNVRDAGNVLRADVGGGLSVTVAPTLVQGTGNSPSDIPVTTNTATAAISNGTAPFTVVWEMDQPGWTATTPGFTATGFRYTVAAGDQQTTAARAHVTDVNGLIGVSNDITASVQNNYGI